jgi:tetratricopeptide (TPR) repeat protein
LQSSPINEVSLNFEQIYKQALIFVGTAKWQDAFKWFQMALLKEPGSSETLYNLGLVCEHLDNLDLALEFYEKAIEFKPDFVFAHINRGILLHKNLLFQRAIDSYDRALSVNPILVDAWLNRGNSLHSLGRYQEALYSYNQALEIQPGAQEVIWNKSLINLTLGNFSPGWVEYESRFKVKRGVTPLFQKTKRLDNYKKIKGKKILVWHEQGYGDSVQFCRYLNLISEAGGDVVFFVQSPLIRILKESFPYKIVDCLGSIGRVDYQIPLLSIPNLFCINPYSLPTKGPYLNVPQKMIEYWRGRLKIEEGKSLNIGLAVSGNSLHIGNSIRSIGLSHFSKIDAKFYLIQKDLSKESLNWISQNSNFINCGDLIEDFCDSAAILQSMDLVISVDTSLAHLSGSLGIKTLLLLPKVSEWRWFVNSEKTPWYGNMTLFRQDEFNKWESVISKINSYLGRMK